MTTQNYIYGLHPISALVSKDPERVVQLYVQVGRHDGRMQSIIDRAKEAGIKIQAMSRDFLDKVSGNQVHQGIVAQVKAASQNSEADLWQLLDGLTEPALLLVLDGVQDPHNLGACLRSANAAGVQAVIVPKDKAAALTPVVEKVACGAAAITPLFQVTNLVRTLDGLKQRGVWIYGASDDAEQSLFEANLSGGVAWVLGAEGAGLRHLTRENCDVLLHIPMRGTVTSLNVAVAAGVCLFETVRQKGGMQA